MFRWFLSHWCLFKWLTAETADSLLVELVCGRDLDTRAPLHEHFCTDSDCKWRRHHKMAAFVSMIFWLYIYTVGGRREVSSIFVDIEQACPGLPKELWVLSQCLCIFSTELKFSNWIKMTPTKSFHLWVFRIYKSICRGRYYSVKVTKCCFNTKLKFLSCRWLNVDNFWWRHHDDEWQRSVYTLHHHFSPALSPLL